MDEFLRLPLAHQAELLDLISGKVGLPAQALEKDIWLCWALDQVFSSSKSVRLAFKGGTSLSKVFNAIQRFSEDVDVTLNYIDLLPDFDVDPFDTGTSKSAIKRYSEQLKLALSTHVHSEIVPSLESALVELTGDRGTLSVNDDGDMLKLRYPVAVESYGEYMNDWVLIEFGGRNTTLPNGLNWIEPIVAAQIEKLRFPSAEVMTLAPERTFWEKATLIHVECNRQRQASPERISRHWYDLYMLGKNEIGRRAIEDRALLEDVLRIKTAFFNASYAHYDQCLQNRFRLVPQGSLAAQLEADYRAMIVAGMFIGEPPEFQEILRGLSLLECAINGG